MGISDNNSQFLSGVTTGIVAPIMLYVLGSIYLERWATLSNQVEKTEVSLFGTHFIFIRQESLDPVTENGKLVLNLNGEANTMRKGSKIVWPPRKPIFSITLEDVELGSRDGTWVARFKIERVFW